MTNKNRIVVSGTTLVLIPELAKHLGKSPALVLQQLHYWLSQKNSKYGIVANGIQWIRNSYKQWQTQIPHLSTKTIQRAFGALEEKNIVLSKTVKDKEFKYAGGQIKFFTINYDALEQDITNLLELQIHRPDGLCTSSKETKKTHDKNPINQGQNVNAYITETTSNLKKYHKKNLKGLKSEISQQDGNLKNIFDSDQIQNILSMKQIWGSVVEGKESDVVFEEISKHEQAFLLQAYNQYFSSDLNHWKSFCTKITTSSFLMGEKTAFKVSLSWVLKFANLQKILDGTFYSFGDRTSQPFKVIQIKDEIPLTCDLQQDVERDGFVQESLIQQALDVRHKILQRVGEGAYNSWFSKARLVLNDRNQYVLCVENTFMRNSIKNRFELDLKGLIDDVCLIGEVETLLYKDSENKVEETPVENFLKASEALDFEEEISQEVLSKSDECVEFSCSDDLLLVDTSLNDQDLPLDEQKTPLTCDLQQDVEMDGFVQESLIKQALDLRQKVLQRVGEGAYNSWFSKARLVLNDRNQYVLCVENTFMRNSIKNRFELDLKGLIDDVCLIGDVETLLYKDSENMVEDLLYLNEDNQYKSFQETQNILIKKALDIYIKKKSISQKDVIWFIADVSYLIHNCYNY